MHGQLAIKAHSQQAHHYQYCTFLDFEYAKKLKLEKIGTITSLCKKVAIHTNFCLIFFLHLIRTGLGTSESEPVE